MERFDIKIGEEDPKAASIYKVIQRRSSRS
jgi:hypothetical protein